MTRPSDRPLAEQSHSRPAPYCFLRQEDTLVSRALSAPPKRFRDTGRGQSPSFKSFAPFEEEDTHRQTIGSVRDRTCSCLRTASPTRTSLWWHLTLFARAGLTSIPQEVGQRAAIEAQRDSS
jgi:hypothetical protein